MASEELFYATIRDIGSRLRRRAISPVELTQALLGRVARLDKTLNAFVTLTGDRAMADARAAETALGRGDAGPLAGIPLGYKDLYATRGVLTTGGSALLADWVPDFESTCTARLAQAGAVMLGKLITHEFAFGIQFPGHRYPAARNPWNVDHVPGGSSSGSGTALAAGMVLGRARHRHGRLDPWAGLVLRHRRPQADVRPRRRCGVLTLSWTLDHTGPMARTVDDCAYLMNTLAGHDATDPASSTAHVADYVGGLGGGVKGLRIGVPRAYFFDGVDPEVAQPSSAR